MIFEAPLYYLGKNHLETYRDFLLEKNVYYHGKLAVAKAMSQMALYFPEKKEEIIGYFHEVLRTFLDNTDDENLFDSNALGFLFSDLLDMNEVQFLPYMKQAFDLDLVSVSINGDYAQVEEEMMKPWGEWNLTPYPINLEEYYTKAHRKRLVPNPSLEDIDEDKLAEIDDLIKMFASEREGDAGKTKAPKKQPVISRNAPCPCGSGKKYKRCCG